MKNYFKNYFLVLTTLMLIGLQSCERDDLDTEAIEEDVESSSYVLTEVELSKEQLAALEINGIIPETTMVTQVKGAIGDLIVYDGILIDDIYMPYKEINEIMEAGTNNTRLRIRQSRVSFPTNGRRNLSIGIVTQGEFGLNATQRNAVITAVQRYNALNMNKIRYTSIIEGSLSTAVSADTYFIVGSTNNNADANTSFPFSGNPGREVRFNPRTRTLSQSTLTLLAQHEMGHSLGLIHSDFRTRRSCGLNSSESTSGIELIPGTNSSGNFTTSIMRACGFDLFGNFQSEDINSLRTAYSGIAF